MPTLLHIDSSPRGDYSISRQLSKAAVAAWQAKNPEGKVIVRDLTKTPLTFVDLDWIMGAFTPPETHTPEHKKAIAISDELTDELLSADEIVIGAPMYNFSIPAVLKAWIDHIARAGKTFKYGENGRPEGLAGGRKVVVLMSSGGFYTAASGMEGYDLETPYLKQIFGFLGITDVTVVKAGGTTTVTPGQPGADEYFAPLVAEVDAAV